MDSCENQNIISFCTGYGGLEMGLHRAIGNLRTVCYVEIEAFAIANLVAKIEQGKMDAAPIWTDIKTFPAQSFSGKVHGIIGGYPCQPFSYAGKRLGHRDPRHLWPYIEEHVRTIRPIWCFFENVLGHLDIGFYEVCTSLRNMGYKVEAGIFTAVEVGSPQPRPRLFILAYSVNHPGRSNPERHEKEDQVQGERGKTVCGGKPKRASEQRRKWPAARKRPQYKWEEPRTVESGMGRTVDGFASRVDELRLLGNGVVPATAELAFRTLWERFSISDSRLST